MPPAVQLLACAFALAMAYLSYVAFRKRHFGIGGFVFWEIIWAGLVVVSLAPELFQPLTRTFRVARLMDLVVVVGMLVLGAATYQTYVTVERLRRQVERLVRELALSEVKEASKAPRSES
jgi:hypothetical protein